MPSPDAIPWDAIPIWPPKIHLAIFVHRVSDLSPGLYFLMRTHSADSLENFQKSLRPPHMAFLWEKPPHCPDDLPLFLLKKGDVRTIAKAASCVQDIAADSAFSLGMISEFEATLEKEGAHSYRHLFWETGMIGQLLYLEAESHGVRGTGIGCFFDDLVHEIFGFSDAKLQSLYHFTVGGPIEDHRIQTSDPYES